jgi:hypothetical protein
MHEYIEVWFIFGIQYYQLSGVQFSSDMPSTVSLQHLDTVTDLAFINLSVHLFQHFLEEIHGIKRKQNFTPVITWHYDPCHCSLRDLTKEQIGSCWELSRILKFCSVLLLSVPATRAQVPQASNFYGYALLCKIKKNGSTLFFRK